MAISKRVLEGKNTLIFNEATLKKIFEFYINTEMFRVGELGRVQIDDVQCESCAKNKPLVLHIIYEPVSPD